MAAKDVLRNSVKEKLARGEVVASMTVRLVRTIEIARIAKTAGFDMLYIDLEHSPLTIDATGQICMACLENGVMPAVRVPANTPEYIGRVLDAGALGIIAPGVRSAEEAREVVKAAKFAPAGERGNIAPMPHLQYRSFPAAEAMAAVNDATMVIVQFESKEAAGPRRGDHRRRRRRYRPGRAERLSRRLRPAWPVRPPQGAGDVFSASSRRAASTANIAVSADLRAAPDLIAEYVKHRRALRLDRHRYRLSGRGCDRQGEADQGHQALMAETQAKADRVYASAVAADAFARSVLSANGVPDEHAATVAHLPGPCRPARRRHPRPVPPADLSRSAAQWA